MYCSHYLGMNSTILDYQDSSFPLTLSLLEISIASHISSFFVNPHFVVIKPFILNNSQLCGLLLDEVLILWIGVVLLVYVHEPLLRF